MYMYSELHRRKASSCIYKAEHQVVWFILSEDIEFQFMQHILNTCNIAWFMQCSIRNDRTKVFYIFVLNKTFLTQFRYFFDMVWNKGKTHHPRSGKVGFTVSSILRVVLISRLGRHGSSLYPSACLEGNSIAFSLEWPPCCRVWSWKRLYQNNLMDCLNSE